MNEQQIIIASNAIVDLMGVTQNQLGDILDVLANNIISEEDCGRIREKIAAFAVSEFGL